MKWEKNKHYNIIWLDHCTCYNRWTEEENIDLADFKCESSGMFIKESKTSIFIGQNRADKTYSNVMQILKSTIVKARKLK